MNIFAALGLLFFTTDSIFMDLKKITFFHLSILSIFLRGLMQTWPMRWRFFVFTEAEQNSHKMTNGEEKSHSYLCEYAEEWGVGRAAPEAAHQSGHEGGQRLAEAHVPPVLDVVR